MELHPHIDLHGVVLKKTQGCYYLYCHCTWGSKVPIILVHCQNLQNYSLLVTEHRTYDNIYTLCDTLMYQLSVV